MDGFHAVPGTAVVEPLREEASKFTTEPYLLTVDGEHRPHCITTSITWREARIIVRAPSEWNASEAAGHKDVSLLWPPAETGGYSLIVDGVADACWVADEMMLMIDPTRAVLHRAGRASDPGSSCSSDCVSILPC